MPQVSLLEYDLGAGVRAFSTERHGGYSEGAYASFNANAWCGDEACSVALNRGLLCRTLGLEPSCLVMPHQVHADRVCRIDEAFFRLADADKAAVLEGMDALTTDVPRVCVSVSTADCTPILIYDARHRAVAAVHAGWRSTVARIPEKTLAAMAAAYGTRADDVRVAIGPSISLESFEVGDEVYEAFRQAGFPMGQLARRFPAQDGTGGEKWHIDLWQANRCMLELSGVPGRAIHVAGICTYRHADRFFSARRSGIRSGRILNGIFLTGRQEKL